MNHSFAVIASIYEVAMKIWKIALFIIVLLILYIPACFIYTRFCLPQYKMDDNTLTYKENVYIRKDSLPNIDTENLGKTIGIAIYGKRTLTDYIWPFWVSEYKDDKEHNRIFVRGLMDLGSEYEKD
jgi:hypothetical protein